MFRLAGLALFRIVSVRTELILRPGKYACIVKRNELPLYLFGKNVSYFRLREQTWRKLSFVASFSQRGLLYFVQERWPFGTFALNNLLGVSVFYSSKRGKHLLGLLLHLSILRLLLAQREKSLIF